MRLLVSASQLAINSKLSRLGPKVLADAYRARTRCNDDRNWFLMDWPQFIRLRETPDPPTSKDDDDLNELGDRKSANFRRRKNLLRSKR